MIKPAEYAKRRKQLLQQIGKNAIVIIPAATQAMRSNDTEYPYRQNNDLLYLTGFEEPETVFVLSPKRAEGEYILFNRVRDRQQEIWNGLRAGQEGACEKFGADLAFPYADFEKELPAMLAGRDEIYYTLGLNKKFDMLVFNALNKVRGKIRNGMESPMVFKDISHTLHEMRLIKSPAEINLMRKAAEISAKAHRNAMAFCKPGLNEYHLEAEINYDFQSQGARFPAYTSIVGAGANSCILHYIENNQMIANNDIVLIDAGCEYQNYAADITRCFPANGKFSPEQRDIYEIVLAAQLAGIKAAKTGALWPAMQTAIVKIITQGLIDLKILKGNLDDLIATEAYFPFYMHKSGHWLGLDVHDVGRYKIAGKWRKLAPGMVLTVEPGIYISADNSAVHKRWHNIGIRIEDDVLITEKGNDILSAAAPKTITDIQNVMAG